MPPLKLVLKNLFKHKIRALLTIASLAVALFLLCVLRSLVVALDAGVRAAAANRLIVQSSVSLFVLLPESYQAKLEQVEGVDKVCRWNWFGGYYQKPGNFFAQFATDPKTLLDMYPEIEIVKGSRETFEKERTACLVGDDLAHKFGLNLQIGDSFPLIGTLWARVDGEPWNLKVAAIYHSKKQNVDNSTLFFNSDYLQKSIEAGVTTGPVGVGIYVVKIKPGADRVDVAARIDALFQNGPQRTQTATEAEFQAQFVSFVGNIPLFVNSIGTGVMIAILLASLNTMLMAAREQTRDIGVMKALGFSDGSVFGLMLLQSLTLCGIGGLAGIGIAKILEPGIAHGLGTMFPGFAITRETIVLGCVLTVAVGLVAGIAPAWRARRLKVIEALRTTA